MKKHTPELAGASFAKFFDWGTHVTNPKPVQWLLTGETGIDGGWSYVPQEGDDINPWIDIAGDPTGTRLPIPRLYKKAGLLAVEKAAMDDLMREYRDRDPRHATALRFEDAVVVGPLVRGREYQEDPQDPRRLLVAPRIGRAAARVSVGVLSTLQSGQFVFTSVPDIVSLVQEDMSVRAIKERMTTLPPTDQAA